MRIYIQNKQTFKIQNSLIMRGMYQSSTKGRQFSVIGCFELEKTEQPRFRMASKADCFDIS